MNRDSKQPPVLLCQSLGRVFEQGTHRIEVLRAVDFRVERGERIAIVGASGAGKSTLLHLMGGLDRPSSGTVEVDGTALAGRSESELAKLRNRALGFVYQFHHLLPEFSALENVAMPLLIAGKSAKDASTRATHMLKRVGLEHRIGHKPGEMSGGERQRTAVARAMVHQPMCLLADEPTGNLDHRNSEQIYDLMLELNESEKTALVIVTHDRALAQRMDRCLEMVDGQLQDVA